MTNLTPTTKEEHDSLVAKCQENSWLRRDRGENRAHEFSRAHSIEDLAAFFSCGNRPIGRGVLFGDLAFVNQVDGGDEWWTLRGSDRGWTPFESVSFRRMASVPAELAWYIAGMQDAGTEGCARLDYLPSKATLAWECGGGR